VLFLATTSLLVQRLLQVLDFSSGLGSLGTRGREVAGQRLHAIQRPLQARAQLLDLLVGLLKPSFQLLTLASRLLQHPGCPLGQLGRPRPGCPQRFAQGLQAPHQIGQFALAFGTGRIRGRASGLRAQAGQLGRGPVPFGLQRVAFDLQRVSLRLQIQTLRTQAQTGPAGLVQGRAQLVALAQQAGALLARVFLQTGLGFRVGAGTRQFVHQALPLGAQPIPLGAQAIELLLQSRRGGGAPAGRRPLQLGSQALPGLLGGATHVLQGARQVLLAGRPGLELGDLPTQGLQLPHRSPLQNLFQAREPPIHELRQRAVRVVPAGPGLRQQEPLPLGQRFQGLAQGLFNRGQEAGRMEDIFPATSQGLPTLVEPQSGAGVRSGGGGATGGGMDLPSTSGEETERAAASSSRRSRLAGAASGSSSCRGNFEGLEVAGSSRKGNEVGLPAGFSSPGGDEVGRLPGLSSRKGKKAGRAAGDSSRRGNEPGLGAGCSCAADEEARVFLSLRTSKSRITQLPERRVARARPSTIQACSRSEGIPRVRAASSRV
jgi:hypothetical protein